IRSRIIRTVGDPDKRFTEDALRILRAVRFTSELGFSVDPDTSDAAIRLADTLEYVSAERISAELWRTLAGEYLGCAVSVFDGIFRYLADGDCGRFLRCASSVDDPYVRLALMPDHDADSDAFFKRIRFPSKTLSVVRSLLGIVDIPYDTVEVCRFMRKFDECLGSAVEYLGVLGGETARNIISEKIASIRGNAVPYKLSMLAVSGCDMVDLGLTGSDVGDALEVLLAEVQEGILRNERDVLLEAAKEIIKNKY
ncbi:MAG: hypothetical protein IKU19_05035, partial [Clostridia bacterium]|nr:hypothetical protein [Clostridia bacterium]